MTQVEQLWKEIAAQAGRTGLFRRVDDSHPLDLYAGINHQGRKVLLLIAHETPTNLPPPGIVEVDCNQRGDAEWAIIFQLSRPDYDELFGRLCQDLVDSTREAIPNQGGEMLLRRLGRWRRLLEVGRRRTLSEEELRGLIGELWFLLTVALPRVGPETAVKGWLGPLQAPHDFLLDSTLVEIKTCAPGRHDVMITSLDQLENAGEPLYLALVTLAPSTSTTPDAFTAAMLITEIRQSIELSHPAITEFELRLAEAGYVDLVEYASAWYHVSGVRYFHVVDAFPRLIPTTVPAGVHGVTYVIDLRSCAPFEVTFPIRKS